MERLSISGDFIDCQLYGGRLYLWTMNGSLRIYDYRGIVEKWKTICIMQDGLCRCRNFEYDPSRLFFSSEELRQFLICEQDYLTGEFPTDVEIISGNLYETNAMGLFVCGVAPIKKPLRAIRISDLPLLSVRGAGKRGLVCAAGRDGVYLFPSEKDDRSACLIAKNQSISAVFCTPGVYAYSSIDEPFLLRKDNEGRYDLIPQRRLFQTARLDGRPVLTWTYKNCFFLTHGRQLEIYHFNSKELSMELFHIVRFWEWKGGFVSAESCDYGTVVELENAICLFKDLGNLYNGCTLSGEVTRWRLYPRSLAYKDHVHIIFNDRIDIVSFNDFEAFPRKRFLPNL